MGNAATEKHRDEPATREWGEVMIDLETLGIAADAAIISAGLVAFDPNTGELGPKLHVKVDFASAMGSGRADISTLKWWMRQSQEAGIAVTDGDLLAPDAMRQVATYLNDLGNPNVWGNGSTFDITILESALTRCEIKIPWKFYQARDCRTIEAACEGMVDRRSIKRDGLHHDALDDAIYQAKYISTMWQKLRGIEETPGLSDDIDDDITAGLNTAVG